MGACMSNVKRDSQASVNLKPRRGVHNVDNIDILTFMKVINNTAKNIKSDLSH